MREILFRAKLDCDQGEYKKGDWVEGYFYEECGCTYIFEDMQRRTGDHCYRNCPYSVDPSTLCQFTGLYDKDGNRIWENDRVMVMREDGCFGGADFQTFDTVGNPEYSDLMDIESGGPDGTYSVKSIIRLGSIHDKIEPLDTTSTSN